jgi:hypothetical protein
MSIKVTLATIAIIVALGSMTANGFINSALGQQSFSAELTGGDEVPPVDTNATGIANFQNNVQTVNYQLSVNDLVNVTQAHIHRGEEGENGKIVVTLYNSTMPTGPKSGLLSQGNITAANLQGPLAGRPLTDLISIMENGTAYANVHTKDFPLGEIRGQISGEGDADEEG